MRLGIVGLPNVGKSTLFNAITKAGAESANYPFCTIEPNHGVVELPDERLDFMAGKKKKKKKIPATVDFVDADFAADTVFAFAVAVLLTAAFAAVPGDVLLAVFVTDSFGAAFAVVFVFFSLEVSFVAIFPTLIIFPLFCIV